MRSSERIEVWGALGYGEGTLTLTPEEQPAIRTDLDLMMGAARLARGGGRGA